MRPHQAHKGDMFFTVREGVTDVLWAIRFDSRPPFTTELRAYAVRVVFARSPAKLKRQLETG